MNDELVGVPIDAVHSLQVRTLRSLGYSTRVVLSNASNKRPHLATSYRVNVAVFGPAGKRDRAFADVGLVEPGAKLALDCDRFETGFDCDVAIVFHLVPTRHEAGCLDGRITIARSEVFFLFGAQDHYVEYYRDDGFCSGVLYTTGPFNHDQLGRSSSLLIQAPKGYVARDIDTIVSVINASPDPTYDRTVAFKCSLHAGAKRIAWTEMVPAFRPVAISMRDRADALGITLGGEPEFVCFMGVCEKATLVPLTINRDLRTNCIGLEHSLPPAYYAPAMTGKLRTQAIASFAQSAIFEEGA